MDKIKLDKVIKDKFIDSRIEINGKKEVILVKETISVTDFYNLANLYLDRYFNSNIGMRIELAENDLFGAELILRLATLDKMTNIQIYDDEGQSSIDYNLLFNPEFFNAIIENVSNWAELKEYIRAIRNDIQRQKDLEKSTGVIIETVADKMFDFLHKFENVDVDKLKSDVIEITENISKTNIYNESKPKRKKHETQAANLP